MGHVDGGSAVDQNNPSSHSPQPSWLKATPLINREHKLFSSPGVELLDFDLIHHLVMVGS